MAANLLRRGSRLFPEIRLSIRTALRVRELTLPIIERSGAIATVLVALPYKAFDLDRYFVPKELALHLTALACAACGTKTREMVKCERQSTDTLAPSTWRAGTSNPCLFPGAALRDNFAVAQPQQRHHRLAAQSPQRTCEHFV